MNRNFLVVMKVTAGVLGLVRAHAFLFTIVLLFKSACVLNCFNRVQLFFHSVDLVEVCKNKEKGSG